MDCLFCKIIAKEISANIAYENDAVLAFHDISPKAPTHLLFIPKKHIARLDDIEEVSVMSELYAAIIDFANQNEYRKAGFQTKIHVGEGGGQEVFHLHIHFLSQKKL